MEVGSYSYRMEVTNSVDNSCVISETVELEIVGLPTVSAEVTSPTCFLSMTNSDGSIMLSGFTDERFDYNIGNSYTGSAIYSTASSIPVNGVIVNTLPNPSGMEEYTIRIFDSYDCWRDTTVTLLEVDCRIYDYGDLPDISNSTAIGDYQTDSLNTGPGHLIISGLFLGNSIDEETDGQSSNDALGDGTDEDGIVFSATMQLRIGGILNIPFSATNTTGTTAHFEMWIDWNGDGDFDDTGEMITDIDDNTPFPNYLPINIPPSAIQGQDIGVRLRLSNTDNMTPYGIVESGEVEDYLINISCGVDKCLTIQSVKNTD